jgi:hypothetical protein
MGQVFETYRFVVVTLFGEIGYSQLSQTTRHHKQFGGYTYDSYRNDPRSSDDF